MVMDSRFDDPPPFEAIFATVIMPARTRTVTMIAMRNRFRKLCGGGSVSSSKSISSSFALRLRCQTDL